jgi:hypothetical protein
MDYFSCHIGSSRIVQYTSIVATINVWKGNHNRCSKLWENVELGLYVFPPGAAAASRLYVEAINKLAKQAQHGTWGGSSDIGKYSSHMCHVQWDGFLCASIRCNTCKTHI